VGIGANGHIDSDPLVVHTLKSEGTHPLAFLPRRGYVSPLASRGYPMLEASARATIGLWMPPPRRKSRLDVRDRNDRHIRRATAPPSKSWAR
jgi:hypothetical protein